MSPDIIALQHENTLLRLLLEHATEQNSELLETLNKTTASLERLSAKAETLLAQHLDLISLVAYIERNATGGTVQ